MADYKKLKRAVIKEELYELTGDFKQAVVLNQFIYWSERVKDSKKFLVEELERGRKFADGSEEKPEDISESLKNGWIYKAAEEMIDEVMLSVSKTTMQRVIDRLVEKEWLNRRRNPKYQWDKTYQYRVNLNKIQTDLLSLGYSLEGYSLTQESDESSKVQNEPSRIQNESSMIQNEPSMVQTDSSMIQTEPAIPEITTETTPKTVLETNLNLKEEEDNIYKQLLENIYFQQLQNLLLEKGCSKELIKKTILECNNQGISTFTVKSILDQFKHMMEKESGAAKGIGTSIFDFPQYFADGLKRRIENLTAVEIYELEKQEEERKRENKSRIFYNWLEDRGEDDNLRN